METVKRGSAEGRDYSGRLRSVTSDDIRLPANDLGMSSAVEPRREASRASVRE